MFILDLFGDLGEESVYGWAFPVATVPEMTLPSHLSVGRRLLPAGNLHGGK
jgi:hypothetical protein